MTNPSLQEIDEQFEQKFDGWKIHHKSVPCVKDEFVINEIKSFIHKIIAERDETLRKEILSLPLYKNGSKAIPKGEVVVQLSAISSLLSKE